MTAFIILLLSCLVLAVGGYLWRHVDWQAIEDENKRYYTSDGYHLYYDRKILRRLHDGKSSVSCPLKPSDSAPLC